MIRKLALAVSIAVGSLPLSVYGLGLGDITTKSSLNETFSGQIELLSVPKGQLDGILVELASPMAFEKAGIERVFALSGLRFQPVRLPNGKAAIKVTSRSPINEPFLDFLIEVNWPNGRIVKEYTVLLDPPATTRRKPAPISQAKVTTQPSAATAQPRGTLSGDQYGPVMSNETLWGIASKLRPQGVSIHQMMMALQQANPGAFIGGNINQLKKGAILQVPAADTASDIAQQEALTSFKDQTDEWMSGAETTAAPETDVEAPVAETATEPATDAAEDDAHLRIAPAVTEDESVAGAGETGAGEEASGDTTSQLMLARENAESARLEADELRGQVSELEGQLEDMQRLLALKDDQLAQVQAGIAAGEIEAETPVEEAAVEETAGDEAVSTEGEESLPAEEEDTGAVVAEEEATATEESVQPAQPATDVEPAEEAPLAEEKAVTPVVPEQTSWLEDNMMTLLTVGGGLVGVGVIVGLVSSARRRKEDEGEEQSIAPAPVAADDESILLDEEETTASAATVHDTSFLSEYSSEDLKALHEDTADVDPVAEADVYVAYGRYQQAQEILQEALNSDIADHTTVRYKMLEVLFATQNRDDFVSLAQEMVESGQVDEESAQWQQVKTMGRDLDKNNPLFAEGVSAVDAVTQISTDLETESVEADDTELSLDLSKLAEELDSTIDDDSEPLTGLESMELDLSGFHQAEEPSSEEAEPLPATFTEMGELEVDSALAETELHTEMADLSDLAELGGQNDLEDELADLSAEVEGVMADSTILDQPLDIEEEVSSLLEDMDEELSEAVDQTHTEELILDDQEPESILGEESATKLELAQAYIEMGDREGAVSILQEVEEDGTDDQKDAASRLLSELND